MLPIAQCRATPAFGSGDPASTELSFRDELISLPDQYRIKSAAQQIDLLYRRECRVKNTGSALSVELVLSEFFSAQIPLRTLRLPTAGRLKILPS
jgi:hypothetical protein